jgi:hypothetical protein
MASPDAVVTESPNIYGSLDPERHEIRLLNLEAGNTEDRIVASLSTVSLHSFPDFEALSYVWGDATVRANIKLNGKDVSVTANLAGALCRMRLVDSSRTL